MLGLALLACKHTGVDTNATDHQGLSHRRGPGGADAGLEAALRILVTAAGAGPGVAVIKAVRKLGGFALGLDMSEHSAGLYLADAHALTPAAKDPAYVEVVLGLCREHAIDLAIPILDLETPVYAAARERLAAAGVPVAVNPIGCIEAGNDKVRSFEVCAAAAIPQPARFDDPAEAPPAAYPLLGKPFKGVGSVGIVRLDQPGDPLPRGSTAAQFLWQSFVPGPEYSIDTFGHPDRGPFVAVPRHRLVVRAGQMVQGSTVGDPDLIAFAADCCRAFDVTDVACIQVIRDSRDGGLRFVEINPRYGTGVSLSIAAGVPFPRLQWLAAHDPAAVTPDLLRWRVGTSMIRYWEEIIR